VVGEEELYCQIQIFLDPRNVLTQVEVVQSKFCLFIHHHISHNQRNDYCLINHYQEKKKQQIFYLF